MTRVGSPAVVDRRLLVWIGACWCAYQGVGGYFDSAGGQRWCRGGGRLRSANSWNEDVPCGCLS